MFSFNDIIGHISNLIYALGFSIKDMLWLRYSIVAGCMLEAVYRLNISKSAWWTDIPWLAVYIVLNAVQIAILIHNRSMLNFTETEKKIYRTTFSNFTPGDFQKLLRIGEWKIYAQGETLVDEGIFLDKLIFVSEGLAEVDAKGQFVANIRAGSFVGEMSFLTGNLTSAHVAAVHETRCLVWKKQSLKELMEKNSEIEAALRIVFNTDLISKLAKKENSGTAQ